MARKPAICLRLLAQAAIPAVAVVTAAIQDGVTPTPYGSVGAPTPLPTHPLACQSMLDAIGSCKARATEGNGLPRYSYASCLCYSSEGSSSSSYNTIFDSWAANCASWAQTADPRGYSAVYAPLTTLCDNYSPVTTITVAASTITRTTTVPKVTTGLPSSTGLTASATGQGSGSTTAASSALAISNLGGGLIVWIANMMMFLVSIICLS